MITTRIPMAIIYLVDDKDELPISAHALTNLSAHLNSAINPIFYGIFNPKIREGYRNVLRILSCNRFFNEQPSDSSQSNKNPKS